LEDVPHYSESFFVITQYSLMIAVLPQSSLVLLLVRESAELLEALHAFVQVSVLGLAHEKKMQMIRHETVRRNRESEQCGALSNLLQSTHDNRFICEG